MERKELMAELRLITYQIDVLARQKSTTK